MDRLQSIAVFVKVVDRGSFTAAAADFRISATMVGEHVRSLERWVGGTLLRRTTRRHHLTELGRQAYEQFRVTLKELDDLRASVSLACSAATGLLRVSSTVTFGVHGLAQAFAEYRERHPQVQIELVLSDQKLGAAREGFDVVISVGELADSTMKARSLALYRSILCAAPQYLTERGYPKTAADLTSHCCLGFANPVASHRWRLTGPDGEEIVPVNLTFQANNGEALRMAALSGLGIIMQPEILVHEDIVKGRLIPILEDHVSDVRPTYVMYHPDRAPLPKVRTFVDFLVEKFANSLTPAGSQ